MRSILRLSRCLAILLAAGSASLSPALAQLSSSLSEEPRRPAPAPARPRNGGDIESSVRGGRDLPPPSRRGDDDAAPAAPRGTPALRREAAPAAPPPPAVAAEPGPDLRPVPSAALVAQAEAATVLIVADDGTGTGFFIDPRTIATNAHVVRGARDGTVRVTSRRLARVLRGRVLYQSSLDGREWPDVALVRLEEGAAPAVVTLSPEVAKLDPVVAAGYPGLLSHSDQSVRRLLAGDAAAAPELVLERGTVATFDRGEANLIVHSAFLANGNSGGPLFDQCGRAVGINSAILRDGRIGGQYNIAQDVRELVRQARRLSVPLRFVGGKCLAG